jgi:hypothetical protein
MFEEGKIDLETEFVNHVIANQTPPKELSQSQFDDVLRFLVEG